jgi:hypothetical protein
MAMVVKSKFLCVIFSVGLDQQEDADWTKKTDEVS